LTFAHFLGVKEFTQDDFAGHLKPVVSWSS